MSHRKGSHPSAPSATGGQRGRKKVAALNGEKRKRVTKSKARLSKRLGALGKAAKQKAAVFRILAGLPPRRMTIYPTLLRIPRVTRRLVHDDRTHGRAIRVIDRRSRGESVFAAKETGCWVRYSTPPAEVPQGLPSRLYCPASVPVPNKSHHPIPHPSFVFLPLSRVPSFVRSHTMRD